MSDEFDDLDYQPRGDMPPWALPVFVTGAAVAAGLLVGSVFGWLLKPATVEEVLVPRDLNEEELAAVCAPFVLEKTNEIEEVQERVSTLTSEVEEKQQRVRDLEAEMSRRLERGKDLIRELERAKADLAETKVALAEAVEQKEQLIVELKDTVEQLEKTEVKLEKQVKKTERAKEDALVNKYYRFIGDTQLEICDRGMRKKMGKCRETVEALLDDDGIRDAFAHCVRSGQATPSVYELPKKEQLPEFAQFLNEEDRVVKGWYLLLCDPTLPERDDGFLNEEHLPETKAPVDDPFGLLEDEEDW